jgi:hypothetical protein
MGGARRRREVVMAHVDKVIVTNVSALKDKYGEGYASIRKAVDNLIKADARRGLQSRLVELDAPAAMKVLKGTAVKSRANAEQNKRAIDAVCGSLRPDYVLILGSSDVVPHQMLANPVDDGDNAIPSDLPYACDAPYGKRPEAFRGPTRVIGRLPDVTGSRDPAGLAGLLETAAGYQSRPRGDYEKYLGTSTEVWKGSTSSSLKAVFGSSKFLRLAPPKGPNWSRALLARRAHFINCHGSPGDPFFYGQKGTHYPQAHAASYLQNRIAKGTVVAAECCYGAELYDPAIASGQPGICNSYLGSGANAFFGSSNIAYGPSDGNASADLICRFFFQQVLEGASLGRAVLAASQRFSQSAPILDPIDLKTLAQFMLLGDPSIHPVEGGERHDIAATLGPKNFLPGASRLPVGRGLRREWMARNGLMLSRTVKAAIARKADTIPAGVRKMFAAAAKEDGLKKMRITSFCVDDPAGSLFREAKIRPRGETTIHMAVGSHRPEGAMTKQVVAVVATVEDGAVVRIRKVYSR